MTRYGGHILRNGAPPLTVVAKQLRAAVAVRRCHCIRRRADTRKPGLKHISNGDISRPELDGALGQLAGSIRTSSGATLDAACINDTIDHESCHSAPRPCIPLCHFRCGLH